MSLRLATHTGLTPSTKVALIGVFAAAALGTNYVLIDVPNVKLMDAFVFIAAYLFGLEVGLGSAVSIWAVYGLVNPYGVDDPLTFSFVVIGECFYAISALGLSRTRLGKNLLANNERRTSLVSVVVSALVLVAGTVIVIFPEFLANVMPLGLDFAAGLVLAVVGMAGIFRSYRGSSVIFGLVGLQATFAYDVLTNFGSWLFKTTSVYQALIIGVTTGVPFAIVHEASNLVFFATVVPAAIAASSRLKSGPPVVAKLNST